MTDTPLLAGQGVDRRGPVLVVKDLSISLPGNADRAFAVKDATFELQRGEVLCLLGGSGAGKSAVAHAIMGALPGGLQVSKASSIELLGQELVGLPEHRLRRIRGRRIAMIFQEPTAALNPAIAVGEQIDEVFALHSRLSMVARREQTLSLLEATHLADPARIAGSYPHQLSGGECQRVVIAMALAMNPEVLVADEPTSALDVTTQAQVLGLIRELQGKSQQGILFITHDFGVVAEIADRVAVMQSGRIVETGRTAEVLNDPRHAYTRSLLRAVPRLTRRSGAPAGPAGGEQVLVVKEVTKDFGSLRALHRITLELTQESTLAIVGESGAGKSTLARLIVRLIEPSAGRIHVGGTDLSELWGARLRAERRAVQMIFQDSLGALNPRRAIGKVIVRAARIAGVGRDASRRAALNMLEVVGLPPQAFGRLPHEFSGGQRQRINIARALAMKPRLLIVDEGLSGLDVSAQAQILELLSTIRERFGLSILLITHDLRVAAQIGDQIAVMKDGRIVETGPVDQVVWCPRHPYTKELFAAIPGKELFEASRS